MPLEVERTYDAPAVGAALPDLVGVAGVVRVARLPDEHLEATYWDTADLRLVRSRATLRRRTGGRDAGWHLKLPAAGEAREEVHAPLAEPEVPDALRERVAPRTGGAALQPVAVLRTTRAVHQLLAADGQVLAELADDLVRAEVLLDGPRESSWRELEVELVEGGTALLDAVEERMGAVGIGRSRSPSKLGRALGTDGR